MSGTGRPLRFIAAAISGWAAFRAVMLWPVVATAVDTLPLRLIVGASTGKTTEPFAPPVEPSANLTGLPRRRNAPATIAPEQRPAGASGRAALAIMGLVRFGAAAPITAGVAAPLQDTPLYTPVRRDPAPSSARWSASMWFLARAGTGLGAGAYGGQLGGGQAGLRVAYAIDSARRVAIVGRIATPLADLGREAAIGVEWRPTRLPIRIVAEHRIAIDGGGGGPAIGLVGGAGPAPIGGHFRIEGYAQAGIIGRDGVIGFGDGAVRINRPIAHAGRATIDLGAGAWGGIQPGAQRLDIGPSLGLSVPIAGRPVRLSIDWRERIGGAARPGSGFALTLGSDF